METEPTGTKPTGPRVEEMTAIELVDFAIATVTLAIEDEDVRAGMRHGKVLTETKDGGASITNGLCGCAIGLIACYDGETFRAAAMGAVTQHFTTAVWRSGDFGGFMFASMSRAFEHEAYARWNAEDHDAGHSCDCEYCDQGSDGESFDLEECDVEPEDLDAVIERLQAIRAAIILRDPNTPEGGDALAAVDREWGRLNFISVYDSAY